ncbi:hypothetical protein E4M02_05865 [Brevundimonas sp. S30B]|uniref:hypothetical protein n=1 Tax=unclassified Brevundimonas TaxID=2622653 RepID=UPI0010725CCB|nr:MULTISPECIES: hypothetical protein [unclassified Brevundimonas]QBX38117.1 hypothetical protein E4M01_10275 [Brevundimonas sp. MF30-B]TFW02528.1 hypothetical protein E4M02_05865 [Brevundimonas sp. S30B]
MDPNTFASTAAHELKALEHALDETLARSGAFLQSLAEGRRQAGLDVSVGQGALMHLGAAINGGIAMRGDLVKAHARFQRDAAARGLDFTRLGPLEPKGPDVVESPYPRRTGELQRA